MSRSALHFALVATLAAGAACSGANNAVPSNSSSSSSSSGSGGSDSSSSGGDDAGGASSSGGDDAGDGSSSGNASSGGSSTGGSRGSDDGSTGGSGSSNGGTGSGSGAGSSSGITPGSSSGSNSGSSSGSGSGSEGGQADDGGSDAQSDSAGMADATRGDGGPLSFATDVYPIITDRCIACHTPGGSGVVNGRLDYTTNLAAGAYSQLMMKAMGNVPGTAALACMASGLTRVVPRSSATSLLYNKVNSKLVGSPPLCGNGMPNPAAAPPLTTAQVATIRMWIDQGANP